MSGNSHQIKVQLALPQEKIAFKQRLKGLWQLTRADRPLGILLLLWPALWALWIAGAGNPDWYVMLVFIVGIVLMRSAGSAVHDFVTRYEDGKVPGVYHRPITRGVVKPVEAMAIFIALSLITLFLLSSINWLTALLFVGAVLLIVLYPFVKLITHLQQVFLAIAAAWVVLLAFAAVDHGTTVESWVLFGAALFWTLSYEIEYALLSRPEDIKQDRKSIAILLLDFNKYAVGILQFGVIVLLLWLGVLADRSWFYMLSVSLSSIFFMRQQQLMYLDNDAGPYQAFQNNNCFGMAVFLILMIDYFITA